MDDQIKDTEDQIDKELADWDDEKRKRLDSLDASEGKSTSLRHWIRSSIDKIQEPPRISPQTRSRRIRSLETRKSKMQLHLSRRLAKRSKLKKNQPLTPQNSEKKYQSLP